MPGTDTDQYLPTGTSGHRVPFLDGANTWSGVQDFDANVRISGSTGQLLVNADQALSDSLVELYGVGASGYRLGVQANVLKIQGGNDPNDRVGLFVNGLEQFTVHAQFISFLKSLKVSLSSAAGDQTFALESTYYQEYTGTGGNTWTLPARAGNVGLTFRIKNIGSGADLIVSRAGADQIFSNAAVNTVNVPVGATVDVTAGNTYWNATIIL